MAKFDKMANEQRRRIMEALAKAKPGSDDYDKLLKQKEKLEDIEAKRRDGRIKPIDWFKMLVSIGTTAAVVTADQWFPSVLQKVNLSEAVRKLIR